MPQFVDNGFFFGDELTYGIECKVVGPAGRDKIALRVAGNEIDVSCPVQDVVRGRPNPVFAGGWRANDSVEFTGATQQLPNGERLVAGTTGTVAAPSGEDKVAVRFAGIKTFVIVEPTSLKRCSKG